MIILPTQSFNSSFQDSIALGSHFTPNFSLPLGLAFPVLISLAMKIIPEVTLKAVKAILATGEASRAIAKDLGVSRSLVNKLRSSMPKDTPRPNAGASSKLETKNMRSA